MERTGKDERKRMIWLVRGEKKKNWGKAKMENWRNSQKSFNLYHFTHDSAEQPSASPSRHDCVPLSLCLSWSTDPKAASCAEVCFDSNILYCVCVWETDGWTTAACFNAACFWRPSISRCHCGNEAAPGRRSAGGYCVCMCVFVEHDRGKEMQGFPPSHQRKKLTRNPYCLYTKSSVYTHIFLNVGKPNKNRQLTIFLLPVDPYAFLPFFSDVH